MGLFDWIGRGRRGASAAPSITWHVYRSGDDVVAEDGRGGVYHARVQDARAVRIVPLAGGSHHSQTNGWQVAIAHTEGDVLVGRALSDWRSARDLGQLICERAELPFDELTQRMFSRVGQFTSSAGA